MSQIEKRALLSNCGRYRYWLTRTWDEGAIALRVIMLNPSTADADLDDPTIRRCMAFARREKFGGIVVCNLFALRATDPTALATAEHPIGPLNDQWLADFMDAPQAAFAAGAPHQPPMILAAWGADRFARGRAKDVLKMAALRHVDLRCLGQTKDGAPRHPLYVKGTQPFEVFA